MDLGGTAKAATVASPESTVVVAEKACPATDVAEKSAASGKNGSVPDSSADSMKDSASVVAADSPAKPKDACKETISSPSPKKASDDVAKAGESNSIAEAAKSPSKHPAVTTSTTSEKSQPESEPRRTDTPSNDKPAPQHQDQIDEDDELLKRMEAIEKGEDLPEDANHQNGTLEKTPEKKDCSEKAMDVGAVDADKAMTMSSDASVGKSSESDAVSPASKRKHPFTAEEVEPQVKKVHIADVTDGPAELKATTSTERQHSPAKQPTTSDAASAEPPGPSEPDAQQKEAKPPSVEQMEVDGSPEPEASSPKDVELLPDTEPNTGPDAMDEKSEEISSSVAEQPMRLEGESAESSNKTDNSNVSSSDDKREGTKRSENPKPPDSEVSASVLPTPSGDEAMDVDEDENDIAESSSTGPSPAVSVPVPVVEPPCVKKVAYLCGEEDSKETDEKDAVASTAKPTASSAATSSMPPKAKEAANEQKMEVDSAPKASSSSVTVAKPVAAEPEDVVDSSNVVTTAPKIVVESVEKPSESVKAPAEEDSIVESSQPSSSSDTKKKQSIEPQRDTVHRTALLVKATSTPNQIATELTPSSSNPSTPKSLNPVTTSAVSSSNVYSSTPIHPSFGKVVSSGNVSKITNPPSSIESSRIEADDTTATALTTTTSSINETEAEEKSADGQTTSSAAKSLPSTTDTASSQTTTASAASSDSSIKSASPKKELRHEDSSSSSKGSLKLSGDISEVDSCTASGMNTAEEINLYVNNARKLNGISSTSEGSDLDAKDDVTKSLVSIKREDDGKPSISSIRLDLSRAISPTTSAEQQYEVSVWYEGKELQFMSVERIHGGCAKAPADPSVTATHDASSIDSSSKQSSTATTNGSVSSIGPFALPATQANTANATQSSESSTSSSSSSSSGVTVTGVKSAHSVTVPQMKQTVIGPKALCDLVIEEFKKLRRTFAPDDTTPEDDDGSSVHLLKSPKTPYAGRGRKESAKKSGPRGQKRSKAADSEEEDDDGGNDARTPRSSGGSAAKQATKRSKVVPTNESPVASSSTTPKLKAAQAVEPKQFDICCLARWTDRKYYAGRVTNYREDNKYVVVFEDGCSKTLSRDIIVFGEDGVLPIQHHSIHALTGGDTYEPAIVEEIKRNEANEVVYGVRTASSTLEVTATDIYLTDEQAKWIHNACKDKPDPIQKLLQSGTGSAGTVGGAGDAAGGNVGSGPEGTSAKAASDSVTDAGDKGARSTRSKRGSAGALDKSLGSATSEAGYSGGVGKKGRRGRSYIDILPSPLSTTTTKYSELKRQFSTTNDHDDDDDDEGQRIFRF
uniref:Tudor domain-containing protein n=1 Tax=Anopheles maculatus TaxID=74869 RepID=A0A182S5K2_9DIPT